ncbi:ClpA/ClpB-like protein [Stackebrandtia endophytica]|uniref:ClpA/ClpB-like protein n=1 Tax=Stackebrandtia endophytica TaxID=1496996 RepID=A0A543AQK9_9ACTN|nr:Clp protease N-terminal domain-containing protein [Stackebrandtia endophytica]TQL74881.1 ClpA/ClpB-like protein [Stackebrandtia endophytica]
MFEKFSKSVVRGVHEAVREAHLAQSKQVTEEHLVYGLFHHPDAWIPRMLGHRITRDDVRRTFGRAHRNGGISATEIASLRQLGIDVGPLVADLEWRRDDDREPSPPARRRRFSKPHLPFDDSAKLALEGALAEARQRGDRKIDDRHLLLAILRRGGLAAGVLAEHDITYQSMQHHRG